MKMRRLLSLLLIMAGLNTAHAQSAVEADLTLEFVSSYFELSAPFRLIGLEWLAKGGVVPWASDYYETERFSFQAVSLKATKNIPFSEKFSLPIFCELMASPASRELYFVAGFTIKAF